MRHSDEGQLDQVAVAPHVKGNQLASMREDLSGEVCHLDLDLTGGL